MRNLLAFSFAGALVSLVAMQASAADFVYQPNGVNAAQPDGGLANPVLTAERTKTFLVTRDKVGDTELHLEGIDNLVVLDGEATLVYGGDMKDARMITEGEFHGSSLLGDTKSVEIKKDDIIQIPAGMAQWIKPHPGGHIRYVVFRVPGRKD
jgi:mannose-6-phosphate isomerase-like protein (cupin superfamily)